MNLQGFLNDCAAIEAVAERIYLRLASSPSIEPWLRSVFQQLAEDESGHSRQLNSAALAFEQTEYGLKRIAHHRVVELLDEAEALLQRVKEDAVGAKEALACSIELENKFRKIHLDQATFFDDEQVMKTFNSLARSDAEHLATLQDAIEKFKRGEKKT